MFGSMSSHTLSHDLYFLWLSAEPAEAPLHAFDILGIVGTRPRLGAWQYLKLVDSSFCPVLSLQVFVWNTASPGYLYIS